LGAIVFFGALLLGGIAQTDRAPANAPAVRATTDPVTLPAPPVSTSASAPEIGPSGAEAPPTLLTADEIMARVAANQDRSDALRGEYLYQQHVRIMIQKANGTRMRDETGNYLVTPTAEGTKKELISVQGHYRRKGRYVEFHGEPVPDQDSIDGNMLQGFRDDLLFDKSKDGLASDLFPLTTEAQKEYRFQLVGQEVIHGRASYRLKFGPKDRSDIDWAGEADVDVADLEPVRVYTKLSRPIPFLIRKFLVDLPGVGFNVEYARQPDGVWFPVSFGTEFRVRVLMFFARSVIVSMANSDFERAHVEHSLRFEGAAPIPPQTPPASTETAPARPQ
jgi:hypothetical protein